MASDRQGKGIAFGRHYGTETSVPSNPCGQPGNRCLSLIQVWDTERVGFDRCERILTILANAVMMRIGTGKQPGLQMLFDLANAVDEENPGN